MLAERAAKDGVRQVLLSNDNKMKMDRVKVLNWGGKGAAGCAQWLCVESVGGCNADKQAGKRVKRTG
jgi:hypothetical protein